MNKNDNIQTTAQEDVIELGIASVETKGQIGVNEGAGFGGPTLPGISEE